MRIILILYFCCFIIWSNVIIAQSTWQLIKEFPDSVSITSLIHNEQNLFAGTSHSGVYISSDSGENWASLDKGSLNTNPVSHIFSMGKFGNNIFAGTVDNGIYRSTDQGSTWNYAGLNNQRIIRAFGVSGNNIYASHLQVFRSIDSGATWTTMSTGLIGGGINVLTGDSNRIYAISTLAGKVYSLNNEDTVWKEFVGRWSGYDIKLFYCNGKNIFININMNYASVDSGITWDYISFGGPTIIQYCTKDSIMFGVTEIGDVFMSINDITKWKRLFSAIPQLSIRRMIYFKSYLLATTSHGIYRYSLLPTSVQRRHDLNPPEYVSIQQNYPNPFNSSTSFIFSLPRKMNISLKVFNSLGKDISTLISDTFNAGTYQLHWDASTLASGIYFYQLRSEEASVTKRLILLK
jgi:hypothetical protein